MLHSNLTAHTLKVEAESYFEMSATTHQSKWRLVPDCVILHQYCRENLRPHISKIYFHIICLGLYEREQCTPRTCIFVAYAETKALVTGMVTYKL